MIKKYLLLSLGAFMALSATAQENINTNKFRQLKQELATPNSYRNAAGAPGHEYYQNQANYDMQIELDDEKQIIRGKQTVTYINNSPDALTYLWVQLDQNMRAQDSDTKKIQTGSLDDRMNVRSLKAMHNDFDGGFKLDYLTDTKGNNLNYTVNKTMLRIDLPTPLKTGQSYSFKVKWWYNINDRMEIGGRSGYEYFEEDDNYLYTIAQYFPRMAVYNDVEGWQNKQFLGRGEFALPFGDYKVAITVPSDHVVAATGELQNAAEVLTPAQKKRLDQARNATETPVIVCTQDEAIAREPGRSSTKSTWVFKAKNVRDFGFASSRKFIWDAMAVKFGSRTVMAMSFYPKEGNPLWEQYSTKVVAQTLKTYSKHTFDYPYPVAQSIHAAAIGMEYPMICFNYGRPEKDGTYSDRTKYGMIGVIIHEVGHNFFPMIVNSDERQWTWMDEGLNTFVQYLTEQELERGYPSRRGPAYMITNYMGGDKKFISPIMTNSESIYQFGNNAYGKPATALNILRETVMGRELFDHAFREYAQRWMFKHPTPADFFRTMEDASAVDLDWFWRGWFYTTDNVEIGLDDVKWFQVSTENPEIEMPISRERGTEKENRFIGNIRNKTQIKETYNEKDPSLNDFYNTYDQYEMSILDQQDYEKYLKGQSEDEKEIMAMNMNYYQLDFSNNGGLVMPIILEFEFMDGTTQREFIPAEIWKTNDKNVSKVFAFEKAVKGITLDPNLETADTDLENNYWPKRMIPTRFEMYKSKSRDSENPMQRAKRAEEAASPEKD